MPDFPVMDRQTSMTSPMALDSKERVGPATGSTLSPKAGAHHAAGDASNAWAGGRGGAHPPSSSSPLVVPHVRQMYNWDCGLACVLMVLRAAGARGLDLRTLRAAAGTQSVWTVDLAHLLSAFGRRPAAAAFDGAAPPSKPDGSLASITLTTTWAGANPAYAGEAFYAPTLAADRARVGALFAGAPAAGVAVETRRVSAAELGARLVSGRTAIIALVDKSVLAAGVAGAAPSSTPATPDRLWSAPLRPPSPPSPFAAQAAEAAAAWSGRASPRLALRRRLSSSTGGASSSGGGPPALATTSPSASPEPEAGAAPSSSSPGIAALLHAEPPLPAGWATSAQAPLAAVRRGYLGHYVVLCGFDPGSATFSLRDPAAGPGTVALPAPALDAARWAWGTDEDLLLVELP